MRSLWYTGYIVASLACLVLAYLEWQVPGFVSFVFPVYAILIVAIVCGLGTLLANIANKPTTIRAQVGAMLIGAVIAMVIFRAGEAFGIFRLVLALVAVVLPLLLLKALTDVKE